MLGTGTLNSSDQATFTTSSLPIGTDAITAVYGGDLNFNGSTSNTVNEPVGVTTTALTDNGPNPSISGQAVSYAVNTTGIPDGTAVYLEDASNSNAVVGSVTVTSGAGSTTVSSLSVGTHEIFAYYGGDGSHTSSQSGQVQQVVNNSTVTTTTTLTDNGPNPSIVGNSVSYTVNTTGVPNGATVELEDADNGNAIVGSVVVNSSGTGSTTISNLSVGTHQIFATYTGTTGYSPSQSSPSLTQTVNPIQAEQRGGQRRLRPRGGPEGNGLHRDRHHRRQQRIQLWQ